MGKNYRSLILLAHLFFMSMFHVYKSNTNMGDSFEIPLLRHHQGDNESLFSLC